MFLCQPIRKLKVSIDQSSYLIYSVFSTDLNSKETSIYETTLRRLRSQIIFFCFSSFIFKNSHVLVEKHNPSEEIVIVKEELDGIDIDDIGNLENLLRIVFIHEECGNLKVLVDGRELTGNINKKRSLAFYKLIDVHSVINVIEESISSIRMWNIVNQ